MNKSTLTDALLTDISSTQGVAYINGQKGEKSTSYAQLRERALGLLYHLQALGLQPGHELLLLVNDNQQFIEAFWAGLLGRLLPVSVATGHSDEHKFKFFRILQKLDNPFLLTSIKILQRLEIFAQQQGLRAEFAQIKSKTLVIETILDLSQEGQIANIAPEDIAFLQFSSGSTGQPKGVMLTHANLLANTRAIIAAGRLHSDDVMLSWMPLTHDMGMIGLHLTPLVLGVQHYVMPTELFVRRPLLWLEKTAEKRASIIASPNFGYQHCLKFFQAEKLEGIDLSAVRLIFNGAEPISVDLCEKFMTTFAPYGLPPQAMFPVYGLAEASLGVTFPEVQSPLQSLSVDRQHLQVGERVRLLPADAANSLRLVCVGRSIPNCEFNIVDEAGLTLSEYQVGHVLIRGLNVTQGYYRDPAATQAVLHADGWLDTGDLGFQQDAQLYLTGRAKELIIIHGQNYYPYDLEAICQTGEGLELGKIAACGVRDAQADTEQLLMFVIFKGSAEEFLPIVRHIKQRLNEQSGLQVQQVLPIRSFPKTTSGKIQRYALAQAYLQGQFADIEQQLCELLARPVHSQAVSQDRLLNELKTICAEVVPHQVIDENRNIFELGASSLALAQIHERVDAAYPDQLELSDFFQHPTLAELAALLQAKLDE